MNAHVGAMITQETVAEFRRKIREQQKNNTRAKAKKRLIASGALTRDGKPRWPTEESKPESKRISLRKEK